LQWRFRLALNASFHNGGFEEVHKYTWPARSPDLTPFHLFMWGCVENIVRALRIGDFHHLRQRTSVVVAILNARRKHSTAWMVVELQILLTLTHIAAPNYILRVYTSFRKKYLRFN
jgi:hypothetical protein